MTAIEEMCQVFKHSPEEQERIEKSYFRAEVLNGESLFVGRAIFEFDKPGRGMFFPDERIQHVGNLKKAAILRDSKGREFVLSDFEPCLADSFHCHFSYEVMSETK